MNMIEWKERRKMINFLYEKGWQPSFNKLIETIQEYGLEYEWEEERLKDEN